MPTITQSRPAAAMDETPADDAAVSANPNSAVCRTTAVTAVGTLTDEDREAEIRAAGDAMVAAFARYEASSCFADRGAADGHRLHMEALIRGRSPAQVARMEQERGLR